MARIDLTIDSSGRGAGKHCLALVYFFFLAVALWVNGSPAICKDIDNSGLELSQVHDFLGPNLVTVSPIGIKVKNQGKMHFEIVSSAPDWDVTIYRVDDKIAFTESLRDFEKNGLWSDLLSQRFSSAQRVNVGLVDTTMCGVKIKRGSNSSRVLKYLPRQDFNLPPQIEIVLRTVYKVPTNAEIPLAFSKTANHDDITGYCKKGVTYFQLQTLAMKRLQVDPSVFKKPTGYKHSNDVREMLVGQKGRQGCDEADVLFGEGDESKHHRK